MVYRRFIAYYCYTSLNSLITICTPVHLLIQALLFICDLDWTAGDGTGTILWTWQTFFIARLSVCTALFGGSTGALINDVALVNSLSIVTCYQCQLLGS